MIGCRALQQESIPFYRRAVAANPEFPEAICGLVNALGGVCDWIGRGGVNEAWVVDNQGGISPCPLAPPGEITRFGYMGEISKLVAKQLDDGHMYGSGAVGGAGDVAHWLGIVSQAIYNLTPREIGSVADTWLFRFESLISRENSAFVNEGGFIIRLIERLMRRVQRRWYLTTFGNVLTAPTPLPRITASQSDVVTYRRPLIPAFLSAPPVPTGLPIFPCRVAHSPLTLASISLSSSSSPLPRLHLPRFRTRDAANLASHRSPHLAQHPHATLAPPQRLPSPTSSQRRQAQHRLRLERHREPPALAPHAERLWVPRPRQLQRVLLRDVAQRRVAVPRQDRARGAALCRRFGVGDAGDCRSHRRGRDTHPYCEPFSSFPSAFSGATRGLLGSC